MDSILGLKKSNCKNCYNCIRNCPVKSIKFSEGQANIIIDECILCGKCFVACPQNAKEIRNDIGIVDKAIKQGRKVIASVAPSYISEFGASGIDEIRQMLKTVGFFDAFETAEGAEIVKKGYEKIIARKEKKVLISSCCHTVNTLIQKYYPNAIKYLADVITPMHAHAKMIKEKYHDAFVVFIGPCISKKDEMKLVKELDCVITFDEIMDYLREYNIEISEKEVVLDDAYRARFFPRAGGIIASMDTENTGFEYYAIDGVEKCIQVLDSIDKFETNNCFIEMNACEGGCINGPAALKYRENCIDSIRRVNAYSGDKDLDLLTDISLEKNINYCGVHRQMPGENAIKDILKKMGKTLPEHELNCGTCGYKTCRDKAVAIYFGKADLTMCLPYLKEKAESFSDKIINNSPNAIMAIDDDLKIIEANPTACRLFNMQDRKSLIKNSIATLFNPSDILEVMETGKSVLERKLALNSYKKVVEQSIVYDEEYHICIIIMKDISDKQKEQDTKNELCLQTVVVADKVIEKQMRVVQEIASLLGETAAETQIALTKLKDAFINDEL